MGTTPYDKIYQKTNKDVIKQRGVPENSPLLKMCLKKVGFDTEFEAEIMAAKRGLRSYRCNFCPHWHLTSKKAST